MWTSRKLEQVAGRLAYAEDASKRRDPDMVAFGGTRPEKRRRLEAVEPKRTQSNEDSSTVRLSAIHRVQSNENHSPKAKPAETRPAERPGVQSVYLSQSTPENRLVTTSLEAFLLLLCHYGRFHLENYRKNYPQNYQLNHQHYRPSDPTLDRLTFQATLQMLGQLFLQFGRLFAQLGQLFLQSHQFYLRLFGLRWPLRQAFRGVSLLYRAGYRLTEFGHHRSKRYHPAARLSNFSSNLSNQSSCNDRPGRPSEHNHYQQQTAYLPSNQRPTYRLQTASAAYQWATCDRSASRQAFADHPPSSTNHQAPARNRTAVSHRPAFTSHRPAFAGVHRPSASCATYQASYHQPAITNQRPSEAGDRARRCTHQFSNFNRTNRTNLFNLRTFIRCLLPSLLGALLVLPNQPVNGQAPANPETPFGEYPPLRTSPASRRFQARTLEIPRIFE